MSTELTSAILPTRKTLFRVPVPNHPVHLNIERLSRQITMPARILGCRPSGFMSELEAISTRLRALGGAAGNKFKQEYPASAFH